MKPQHEPLVLIGYEKLKGIIRQEIKAAQQLLEAKPIHDTISMSDGLKMLEEYGMPTSKAKIYKLTSTGNTVTNLCFRGRNCGSGWATRLNNQNK